MAMVGRKPKPRRLKELDGDPKSRFLSKNEPMPPVSEDIIEWDVVKNNPTAHRAFVDNIRILRIMKMLTDAEVPLINIMAICQARIEEAENQIERDGVLSSYTNTKGENNSVTHPAVGVSMKYAQMLKSLCVEFGMTPSSRGRLEVPKETEKSPLDKLIDGDIGC